ncbi:MAG: class I adenylate-forming enzyme family protein [Proteobacteria bacterium]|nr:class I adenylate-forming enzyme family protein [Pseudomonadota bacterium]
MDTELSQVRVTATTLGDLLMIAADKYPNTDAIVLPTQSTTFAELRERAFVRARSLRALGVKPGDHVGLLLPTCMDFVDSLFAIAMLGAVTVPINARYKPPEIRYVTENADLVTLITTDEFDEAVNYVERIQAAFPDLKDNNDPYNLSVKGLPMLRNIVVYGKTSVAGMLTQAQLDELVDNVSEDEIHLRRIQTRVGSTALILYTSGTTSNPKGCMIAHESIIRNSAALGKRYQLSANDSFWSPLPMFHIAAILPMVTIFDAGGTYVTAPHFEADEALQMLQERKVTATYPSFWTIMSDLISHPDFAKTDLSAMKLMNSNFAVQPAIVGETMEKAMPDTVFVGTFGMTEASGTVSTSRLDDPREQRFTRLGTPLPGIEVKIMDPETGEEMATGEQGDTWIRGNGIFTEYYKSPEKTAEALDDEGWFHSGDICSINEVGQLLFHGRLKDMLKVGGENVAAVEIETCLQKHPAVKLAQVVGVPDARLSEVAAAFIEFNPGENASEEELIDFCKDKLAGFKVPRFVRFVDEWPMSSTKIQKFRLQKQIRQERGV